MANSASNKPMADNSDELERLRAENAKLRKELEAAKADKTDKPEQPRQPTEPSFGMSEGTREELERTGKATSPFTGKELSKKDPRGKENA